MSNEELMMAAKENLDSAQHCLGEIFQVGTKRPVPADMFTVGLKHLVIVSSAMLALQRRAAGVAEPRRGD